MAGDCEPRLGGHRPPENAIGPTLDQVEAGRRTSEKRCTVGESHIVCFSCHVVYTVLVFWCFTGLYWAYSAGTRIYHRPDIGTVSPLSEAELASGGNGLDTAAPVPRRCARCWGDMHAVGNFMALSQRFVLRCSVYVWSA